jgi:PhnB protein
LKQVTLIYRFPVYPQKAFNNSSRREIMTRLDIGLTFPGTAEKAFEFYSSVFGKQLEYLARYNDDSMKDMNIPEKDRNKIAYVMLQVGEDILDADDTLEINGPAPVPGSMMSITVRTDNKDEATRIFKALSSGGNIKLPLADQFWGAYFGALTDKFRVNWSVRYDYPRKG